MAAFAQGDSGIQGDGYYRVRNLATQRYIYLTDNTGSYDEKRDVGDFGAIQLWKNSEKAVSDPASVIYVKYIATDDVGPKYDLLMQGAGLHDMIEHYLVIKSATAAKKSYYVYASKAGITKYLSDNATSTVRERGTLGTGGKGDYREWVADKIETNDAVNYFGVKPTFSYAGKYYHPFYAGFPFKTASEGMKVWYVFKVDTELNLAVMKEITGVIPPSTPVIIECTSDQPSSNRLELVTGSYKAPKDNILSGTFFANEGRPKSKDAYVLFDPAKHRIMSVTSGGKLGFTTEGETATLYDPDDADYEHPFQAILANTSYLTVDASTSKSLTLVTDDEYRRIGIQGVPADEVLKEERPGVFSLTGSQLRQDCETNGLPAGIYVVGGKKVVVK